MTQPGFAIGVDLGTSNTVAVLRRADGRVGPLLVDGAPVMPSGVLVDESGRLHVGHAAQRLAAVDPSRFEPNPKRRIDEPTVLLGGREVPTAELLAAVLAAVADAAVEAIGFLPPAVLTHPAAWGNRRRETLLLAAQHAGWPPVRLVPEPIAAGRYFVDVLHRPIPAGAALAVFDFGGGTLDIAVIRNDGRQFSVLGSGGVQDLGGLDIDAALVEHLGVVINQTAPQVWAALRHPQGAAQRRDRRLFWDDVRGAKEMLSRATVAPVPVPGRDEGVHLTRDELERTVEPLILRAVVETGEIIKRCGLRPDQLAGLFLVGGSSRLPLAARLLHARLGVAPTVLEQPELPVAEGALAELPPTPSVAQPSAAPPDGMRAPATPDPAAGPVPPDALPPSPPASGLPPGSPPPGSPSAGSPNRRWYQRRSSWFAAGAAALVVALTAGLGYVTLWRDHVSPVAFTTLQPLLRVALANAGDIDRVHTITVGDTVYFGWVARGSFTVGAVSASRKRTLWGPKQFDGVSESTQWHMQAYDGKGLFLFGTDSSRPGTLLLVDPGTGAERYRTAWNRTDAMYTFASSWTLFNSKANELTGMSWSDGATKWRYTTAGGNLKSVGSATDRRGPSMFWGYDTVQDLTTHQRLVHLTGDGKLHVVNGTDGTTVRTVNWTGDSATDHIEAADGRLLVGSGGPRYTVRVYDLDDGGEPSQAYSSGHETRRITRISPCGDGLICVLDTTDTTGHQDAEMVMIDVGKRHARWRKPAPGANQIVPVGDHVLALNNDKTTTYLFTADGNQLLKDDEMQATPGRVNSASVLLFSGSLTITDTANVSLVGVAVPSGERVAVGQLPGVRGWGCSWSESVIACPTAGELRLWQFAE